VTRAIRYVIPTFCSLGGDFLHFPDGGGSGGRHFAACCSLCGHERPTEVPDAHDTALYTAHTHTDRTPLHTAPWGRREALQTLSQGTLEAVRRRGCTGGTEDPVPGLKGQPHEIMDFLHSGRLKSLFLGELIIPYHTIIMYRYLSGNKCSFIYYFFITNMCFAEVG
jgi:hypothetical protein